MSPEQHMGERADQRSDLFSFGVLLFEMLTGELPFPESDDEKVQVLVRRMEAGRYVRPRKLAPETPRALERLIRACLRPKAKKRPQSATALRGALERLLGHPSPAECRAEIAAWLWEHKVFQPDENETEFALRAPAEKGRSGPLRRAAAFAACAVVLVGIGAIRLGVLPADLPLPWMAPEVARVRFEAVPRTEVRVDGGAPFRMPRSGPVVLAPGVHHVVFRHPELGSVERRIEVAAGEERTVAHVFETPAESP
jgi:hypothetical protein